MKLRLLTLSLVVATLAAIHSSANADDWTQFRGAGGASVANAVLPKSFDKENIQWKIPLPAKGASGPIVVGDRVIVTCSGGEDQDQLYTVCLDTKTGKELWTQKFWATGRCFVHPISANAAPTPASDGQHVFVFFSSNDLACLDLDGNLVWYRGLAVDHPKAGNDVGMSSSPVVKDGVVVVQVECQGDSFAMGLDADTGITIWTQKRGRDAMWSSPLVVDADGMALVVLQSQSSFDVLNMKTGEPIFHAEGRVNNICSPATSDGKLFVPIDGTTAFSVSGNGQLTKEWNSPQLRPANMSAVVHGGKIYSLNRAGGLFAYDSADGSELAKARVISGGGVWATPVIADNHMYCFSQTGKAFIVELPAEGNPKLVHSHTFEDEVFLGSPAVANNAMYLRSDRFLWKIATQ